MTDKCIVHNCKNHKGEGTFHGDICMPCYKIITTGVIGPTDSFLGDYKKLYEARNDVVMYATLMYISFSILCDKIKYHRMEKFFVLPEDEMKDYIDSIDTSREIHREVL